MLIGPSWSIDQLGASADPAVDSRQSAIPNTSETRMKVFPRECELQTRFRTVSCGFGPTDPFGMTSGPGRWEVGNDGVFMLPPARCRPVAHVDDLRDLMAMDASTEL